MNATSHAKKYACCIYQNWRRYGFVCSRLRSTASLSPDVQFLSHSFARHVSLYGRGSLVVLPVENMDKKWICWKIYFSVSDGQWYDKNQSLSIKVFIRVPFLMFTALASNITSIGITWTDLIKISVIKSDVAQFHRMLFFFNIKKIIIMWIYSLQARRNVQKVLKHNVVCFSLLKKKKIERNYVSCNVAALIPLKSVQLFE